MKILCVITIIVSWILVSANGQQQDPLCPRHEWIPSCVPCIKDCDDLKSRKMCDSISNCIPNDDCHCLPGFARILKHRFCIPESHCKHPFRELLETHSETEVDGGDSHHRISHHDLKKKHLKSRFSRRDISEN
jgi:hypothetical protein